MKELNPKIKDFYASMHNTEVKTESDNYYYVDASGGSGVIFVAFSLSSLKYLAKFARPGQLDLSRFKEDEIICFFDKGYYSEEEMLKVIKMKAFL